jgi:enoyl-CoA hydratase/carnithine racemase
VWAAHGELNMKAHCITTLIGYGLAGGAGICIDSYGFLLICRACLEIALARVFTAINVLILNMYEGIERDRFMPILIFAGRKGVFLIAASVGAALFFAARFRFFKKGMNPMIQRTTPETPVLVKSDHQIMSILLNRPEMLNSLNHVMVRFIQKALDQAKKDSDIRLVLFQGLGDKSFCAGGDVKDMAQAVQAGNLDQALGFLTDEYIMDLNIHRFPKPVVVIADGIIMGAGLGLAAGADFVIATERTRSAMPETRIGFFPDVGATGWMFQKCPPGYPEYLGLTGYEMIGSECVRVGYASHLIDARRTYELQELLRANAGDLSLEKSEAIRQIDTLLLPLVHKTISTKPEMDDWVEAYFAGRTSVVDMVEDLKQCSIQSHLCDGVFQRLSERSPTALVVTLKLLRHNERLPMEQVFEADLKAARFILSYPDYVEGVRARLIDKDDNPHWQPDRIEKVGRIDLLF